MAVVGDDGGHRLQGVVAVGAVEVDVLLGGGGAEAGEGAGDVGTLEEIQKFREREAQVGGDGGEWARLGEQEVVEAVVAGGVWDDVGNGDHVGSMYGILGDVK
jgi:hypothetical protein